MSIWNWIMNYRFQAYANKDPQRQKMVQLATFEALDLMETNPDQSLALLNEAQGIARQLQEEWWVLFCEHWKLQILMHRKKDYATAQKLAVQAAVEVLKPQYASFPQKSCLYEDLINVYLGIDPEGYAAEIESALAYMKETVTPEKECWQCLHSLYAEFPAVRERWDVAAEPTLRFLAESQEEEHHLMYAYSSMCELLLEQQNLSKIGEFAELGLKLAESNDKDYMVVEFLAWQGLSAYQAGQHPLAQKKISAAEQASQTLASVPTRATYKAICAYYQATGQFDKALQTRHQQWDKINGRGQLMGEFVCLREICTLLKQLGQPFEAEFELAEQTAHQMKKPQRFLAQLATLKDKDEG